MTRIILTRHGHVEGIRPERFRGRVDLELTKVGLRQATLTRDRIQSEWRPSAIYSSPMQRSMKTAEIIAEPFGLTVRKLDALNDIDYGEWQGLAVDFVQAKWKAELDTWHKAPHRAEIPGGESLHELATRTAMALRLVSQRHQNETVVLVGHDSVNRALLTQILDLPLSRYWHIKQHPCNINEITVELDGYIVHRMNEHFHLLGVDGENSR